MYNTFTLLHMNHLQCFINVHEHTVLYSTGTASLTRALQELLSDGSRSFKKGIPQVPKSTKHINIICTSFTRFEVRSNKNAAQLLQCVSHHTHTNSSSSYRAPSLEIHFSESPSEEIYTKTWFHHFSSLTVFSLSSAFLHTRKLLWILPVFFSCRSVCTSSRHSLSVIMRYKTVLSTNARLMWRYEAHF